MKNTLLDYKNGKIDIYDAIIKMDLINNSNDKKNEGVIYTPPYISKYIIENIGYTPDKTILEPSVGHGIFIFSLIEYVKSNFGLTGEALKRWFEEKVYAVDINAQNIKDLHSLLSIYFEKEGLSNVSFSKLIVEDGLFYDYGMEFDFSFGNPPYVRTKNLNEDYLQKLKYEFKSCETGNIDLFYAFVEKMSDLSNVSSFIIPNSYLFNSSCRNLREVLRDSIHTVIDFKDELIFDNARTYTSIYKTNKKMKPKEVFYKESLESEFKVVSKKEIDNKQWVFDASLINKTGTSIIDLYPCYGSIATLKDKLYLIEDPVIDLIDGVECYRQFHEGVLYHVETDLCIDFIKITKFEKQYKIIYPYENQTIIPEEIIVEKYPNAYNYFKVIRPILDNRDKGKVSNYDAWYAYGRRQGIQEKLESHYLFMPLMATEEYKCNELTINNHFLSTSGFVLGFNSKDELLKVKNILESGVFFDYLKSKGRPWAGKNPYYSFTKTQLKDFLI